MLTFLRKIRKSLIETGSTRKYILYAIGEIALVVIGILLALQINYWNTTRINKSLEKELLFNFLADVDADIQNLLSLDSLYILAHISKNKIIDYSKGKKLSSDSVFYYLSKTGPSSTFTPTTITYDEMRNSNAFIILQSRELRREIAILYKQYEKIKNNEKMYFDSQSRLRNIRIEDFSTGSLHLISIGDIQDPPQVLNQIKTNRRFINALVTNYTRNMRNSYRETLGKAQKFKHILEEYIETRS